MKNDNPLPGDLADLQRQLCADTAEPSYAMKAKVMAGVENELARPQQNDFWQFAAAVAAMVVLLINLSVSIAPISSRVSRGDLRPTESLYGQIEDLQLGLSDREIKRQCMLLAASETIVPYGRPYGSSPETFKFLDR